MHYIRFLKPPRSRCVDPYILTKITISTDLGESFLSLDVVLLVDIQDQSGSSAHGSVKTPFLWKGSQGMRALEIIIPKPRHVRNDQIFQIVVGPENRQYAVDQFLPILEDTVMESSNESVNRGRIVSVRSMPIDLGGRSSEPMDMAERVFKSFPFDDHERKVHIWEETGESIARHIWDAGLVLSAYLTNICNQKMPPFRRNGIFPQLRKLEALLQSKDLRILELGAGCGIVGLTLITYHPFIQELLLTDLPEASSILQKNISLYNELQRKISNTSRRINHQVLDWSDEHLSHNVKVSTWDLILVADCTYNPDVVPDLVKTLKKVTIDKTRDALICLAMKVRHDSEMIFFELMKGAGYVVLEKGEINLPVLGDEAQTIEIFVFKET